MADTYKINEGTQTTMASDDLAGVQYPRVKISVGADGAAADWQGTINTVAELSNLAKGTITKLEGGTVAEVTSLSGGTVGILTAGTVDTVGLRHADSFGSRASVASGTAGANIHGAVSGSSIYVTDIAISVGTTGVMQVSLHPGGTANTAIIGPYTFAANGGMVSNYRTPIQVTSGSALVYTTNIDGTVTIDIGGYID